MAGWLLWLLPWLYYIMVRQRGEWRDHGQLQMSSGMYLVSCQIFDCLFLNLSYLARVCLVAGSALLFYVFADAHLSAGLLACLCHRLLIYLFESWGVCRLKPHTCVDSCPFVYNCSCMFLILIMLAGLFFVFLAHRHRNPYPGQLVSDV